MLFFLGGCEDNRKFSWVNFDSICMKKEEGGFIGEAVEGV